MKEVTTVLMKICSRQVGTYFHTQIIRYLHTQIGRYLHTQIVRYLHTQKGRCLHTRIVRYLHTFHTLIVMIDCYVIRCGGSCNQYQISFGAGDANMHLGRRVSRPFTMPLGIIQLFHDLNLPRNRSTYQQQILTP